MTCVDKQTALDLLNAEKAVLDAQLVVLQAQVTAKQNEIMNKALAIATLQMESCT